MIDEILQRLNLKFDDLTTAERETLIGWTQTLDSNQLTVEGVKQYVRSCREAVENELAGIKETPQSWTGILALFIPFLGLIKKWYQDQHKLGLEARIRNYVLIEAFLSTPDKARAALERAIAGIASNRSVK